MPASPDVLGAVTQRLIDLGLSGVAILVLLWALREVWRLRESERAAADARHEAVQEKRIEEQKTALVAVSKAIDTVETTIQTLTRSAQ